MRTRFGLLGAVAAVVFFLVAAHPSRAADNLRLHLYWQHQAQFAGYYMAIARGFYAREGLEVTLLESGPGIQPLERLGANAADLSIGWLAHALSARERGLDLVNVAQVFQKSGMGLACRRSAGIDRARKLAGQTVGVWNVGDEINLRLWLERRGVSPASVKTAPQSAGARDLIEGRRNCVTVMSYNEYWNLIEAGIKPRELFSVRFADEGLGLLEDGIYARAERLRDPAFNEVVARFLRASAQGWRYAREHPAETVKVTMRYRAGLDAAHQRRMLESVLALIDPPGKSPPFGRLDAEAFERTVSALAAEPGRAEAVRAAARDAWTSNPWEGAATGGKAPNARSRR